MSDFPTIVTVHTEATMGAVSAEIVAANDARQFLLIINDSDVAVYIKFDAAAVLNEGIRINAAGGSYECSPRDGNLDTRVVNGIASAGSKVVLIAEG